MTARVLLFVSLAVLLQAQKFVEGPDGDCGFAAYKARRIAHFIEKGAISRVTPMYPPAAKAKRLSGTARVRLLVNKQGAVERTCPVFAVGHPRPDRTLMIAAEAAALQWTFPRNFGIAPGDNIQFNYVEGVLAFNFVPEEGNMNRNPGASGKPNRGDRQDVPAPPQR